MGIIFKVEELNCCVTLRFRDLVGRNGEGWVFLILEIRTYIVNI